MKYPYGISDFKKVITQGYFYCDRTDRIPLLEQSDSQLFIRPRRFGKSLLLSMLENYYDVAKKDQFDRFFSHLAIGENPTGLQNTYFILKIDFSCVDPTGTPAEVKQSLFDHINDCIKEFLRYYNTFKFNFPDVDINPQNALSSLKSLAGAARVSPHPIYLLIDEYDNFANTVMMRATGKEDKYQALVHDEGPLRTFFKSVKAMTSGSTIEPDWLLIYRIEGSELCLARTGSHSDLFE